AGAGGGAAGGNGGFTVLTTGGNGGYPGAGGGEKGTLLGTHGNGAHGLVKISYTIQPLTVSYTAAKNFCANVAITPISPTIANGTVTNSRVPPALPDGLSLNAMTGAISASPTSGSPATIYTIKAVNACYTVNTQQSIT